MKIGIISDTHDNILNFNKAIGLFNKAKVSLVIHCGDWVSPFMLPLVKALNCKVISVFGNNEGDIYGLLTKNPGIEFHRLLFELETEGRKIVVFHGDNNAITKALLACGIYDVVITGHTHKPLIERVGATLHINPGSAAGVCEGTLSRPTVGIYSTHTNKVEILELK